MVEEDTDRLIQFNRDVDAQRDLQFAQLEEEHGLERRQQMEQQITFEDSANALAQQRGLDATFVDLAVKANAGELNTQEYTDTLLKNAERMIEFFPDLYDARSVLAQLPEELRKKVQQQLGIGEISADLTPEQQAESTRFDRAQDVIDRIEATPKWIRPVELGGGGMTEPEIEHIESTLQAVDDFRDRVFDQVAREVGPAEADALLRRASVFDTILFLAPQLGITEEEAVVAAMAHRGLLDNPERTRLIQQNAELLLDYAPHLLESRETRLGVAPALVEQAIQLQSVPASERRNPLQEAFEELPPLESTSVTPGLAFFQ